MDRYLIKPNSQVKLDDHDPKDISLCKDGQAAALEQLEVEREELAAHKAVLFARRQEKLLVVLQGMDASGKDGTVRHVFSGVSSAVNLPLAVSLAATYAVFAWVSALSLAAL